VIALRERSRAPELMDTEPVDRAMFEACLKDLERINRWTGAYRITLGWLERLCRAHGLRRLVLVDVGSGYGDMLRRIAAWGGARGVALDLTGVDLNPHATVIAARATAPGLPIRYVTVDVFELSPALRPDVVISSLFAHHLDDRQLVRFVRWMEASARRGWLINDLHRHPVAYAIARWGPHLLGMNRLVRHDAAVSVARSCVRRDWERLLAKAGVGGPPTTVCRRFPFRYAVGRIKAP
jgi:SAM-dependent methyltransferase